MVETPLDRIPSFDRVTFRALIVSDHMESGAALSQAGIFDPVAVPVAFGENPPDASFGDGITTNLIAVLETDRHEADGDDVPDQPAVSSQPVPARQTQPTTAFPEAYGVHPLAPVRRRGG